MLELVLLGECFDTVMSSSSSFSMSIYWHCLLLSLFFAFFEWPLIWAFIHFPKKGVKSDKKGSSEAHNLLCSSSG
jgi:hypothetical protein